MQASGGSETNKTEIAGGEPTGSRWNFGALMVDVSCFSIGIAFLEPSAVLPLLMERLGAGGFLIGLFAALRSFGFSSLQMFVAYATHGAPRQKPYLILAAGITRLPLLLLPFFLLGANKSPAGQTTALIAVIVLLTIWAFGDGLGYVPWMEIVARGFSARTRGRFFAASQLVAGIASILIALLGVKSVLKFIPFPQNYALLAGISALMMQISLGGILFIKEPPSPPVPENPEPRLPLMAYFRRLPRLMRENPIFLRLSIIQLLVGFGSTSQPFYVLYATRHFGLEDSWGGTYQVFQAVGIALLMPVWNWVSEKRGPAAAVRAVSLGAVMTPLFALTLGTLHPSVFGFVFLLMGGTLGWGMWIALNHFLLTHTSDDERPIFVALLNLVFIPSALYPVIGGLLVPDRTILMVAGVPAVFLLTLLVVTLGFLLTLRLPAPDEG